MAEKEINLDLYYQAQEIVRPQATLLPKSEPGKVSNSGSLYCPQFPIFPKNHYDLVYPKLLLGNRKIVTDIKALKSLGVTHVVNTAMGPKFNQINTTKEYYEAFSLGFYGVPAIDQPSFRILPYLKDAAAFIDQALSSDGFVYVHCQQGVSRSATVVLSFLMLFRDMDLLTAIKYLRSKREVAPNDGFLRELCQLQEEIDSSKAGNLEAEN